jgi:predicted AlkP superfamily pyrophosphatase or phosphodiesterase
MMIRCCRWLLSLFACCLLLGSHAGWARAAKDSPRLAVVIVFDQLRGDYLSRWQELFGAHGFRRLQTEGAWFTQCHYPYSETVTAAGHASIHTGCSPAEHGIVGNEWFDQARGEITGCVEAPRFEQVPPRVLPAVRSTPAKPKDKGGISPERLLAPTLADALREATGGKGRVVSLSLKDRSAVLPGGRHPTACYWFDSNTGQFVTSTYYRDRVHSWVADFNASRSCDQWFNHPWQRLRDNLDYARYSGPDDVLGEGKGFGQGRTFPHGFSGEKGKLDKSYYAAVLNSPFGNDLLLDLAKRAIAAEHLGTGETPDLLCLSFSSNDAIGHCWGPDSQEVLDVTLRSDLIVEELLSYLDEKVGKGRYAVALTADHGICPLPEVSRAQGKAAGRIEPKKLLRDAAACLDELLGKAQGKDRWLEALTESWFALNHRLMKERGIAPEEVENVLAVCLQKQHGIRTAYTRTQLLKGLPADDLLGQQVLRSFHPQRSGDVVLILQPYYLLSLPTATGTNHGSPNPYDTHVPLLVYGPGIRAGLHTEPVTPQATVVVLAHALGIAPPAQAKVALPEKLFITK